MPLTWAISVRSIRLGGSGEATPTTMETTKPVQIKPPNQLAAPPRIVTCPPRLRSALPAGPRILADHRDRRDCRRMHRELESDQGGHEQKHDGGDPQHPADDYRAGLARFRAVE